MSLFEITPAVRTMHDIGVAIYGQNYESLLARALSDALQRNVTAVQMCRWSRGIRKMPDWIAPGLVEVARIGLEDLRARQVTVQELGENLRRDILANEQAPPRNNRYGIPRH